MADLDRAFGGIITELRIEPTESTVSFVVIVVPGVASGAERLTFDFERVTEFRMTRRPNGDYYTEFTGIEIEPSDGQLYVVIELWSESWGLIEIRCREMKVNGIGVEA